MNELSKQKGRTERQIKLPIGMEKKQRDYGEFEFL